MKNIYVVLSATPTKIGLAIRTLTRSSFNHASISLDKNLGQMYSFARYRARNALVGGFIREFPERLTLGKDKSVKIKVYKIPVSKEGYRQIEDFVYNIMKYQDTYIYNSLAVLGRPFGLGYDTYRAYVCTDFVLKALMAGGLVFNSTRLNPGQIEEALEPFLYYFGTLEDYRPDNASDDLVEVFFQRYSLAGELGQVIRHFASLIARNFKGQEAS